ncbi:HAD-IIB family hydrolase [Candidatus Uhrbacteria bacterium]|jgi:phosphomannomutase|nr:HAD-IIB family hydrolase [Candidatus Uhrbacteria bacterium]
MDVLKSDISGKKLFVFDFDGTLNRSKVEVDDEMVGIIKELLEKRDVAIISGSAFKEYDRFLLGKLGSSDELFSKLHLFPTSGAVFIRYEEGKWNEVYADGIGPESVKKIMDAFETAFKEVGYVQPEKIYGELIEDRGTQVTFSALGQKAPIEEKLAWRGSDLDMRVEIVEVMKPLLPEFAIKVPGKTSIDVTNLGIDKGYGVEKMKEHLGFQISDMVFIGDALYPGGNDEPVKRTGIESIQVEGPEEVKAILRGALAKM